MSGAAAAGETAQKTVELGVSNGVNKVDNAQTSADDEPAGAQPGLTNGDRPAITKTTNGDYIVQTRNAPDANNRVETSREAMAGEGTKPDEESKDEGKNKAVAAKNESGGTAAAGAAAAATASPQATPSAPQKTATSKKPSGGYDQTPLPRIAPGFTVQFTFHKATNLPAADLHSSSSDPYVTTTLTADVPTRHKEDPIMFHRTRTIHRSTEPEWNEEWVVANIPSSGFRIKCRIYDEDPSDHDDRLGNVTIDVPQISDKWAGFDHQTFEVKKRMGSKRAYFFKGLVSALTGGSSITPLFEISIKVLGRSDPPGGRMFTIGPTTWTRHFSPMIGRLTGTTVNRDEREDEDNEGRPSSRQTRKYDFQANEIQLQGPVPEKLYHRYVEFRPIIGRMFTARGLRGRVLNAGLHKQHERIYNFNRDTEYGSFEPCTEQASLQFLRLVHFDDSHRLFTYMISLDGVMRFTETGKEFGIDLLSKHSMHSDVATYIAFSGEFFIRRLSKPHEKHERHASGSEGTPQTPQPPAFTHGDSLSPQSANVVAKRGSISSMNSARERPGYFQLIIDNDSGTYRPEKALLPILQQFLERQFPGLGVVAMSNEEQVLQDMKTEQRRLKKKYGPQVNMVMNRNSSSSSSISSSDESRLSAMGRHDAADGDNSNAKPHRSKKEMAWDLLEDPTRIKDLRSDLLHSKSTTHQNEASGSGAAAPVAAATTNGESSTQAV